MEIIKSNHPVLSYNETAATIGFFDGVHKGHQFLLEQLKVHAKANNLPSMLITFPQSPQSVLKSGIQPDLLNSFNEKIYRLSLSEIDYCLLLDFTQSLSQLSAKDFIQKKLKEEWNIKLLLIGYDHRFGKNREEGFEDYLKYGKECGIEIIRALELPDVSISSTHIRNCFSNKKLKEANIMLSYNYHLEGKVVEGDHLGVKIGFPTANLEIYDKNKLIPGEGIYAVWVYWKENKYGGMAYVGKRPTISTLGEKRIEVNIFDFSGNLYNETILLEFIEFIREDKQFGNLEELKSQLSLDRKFAGSVLVRHV